MCVCVCVCVPVCICEEAAKVYSELVAPYMSSILEVLTENISASIQGMQHTLHTQMDSALTHTGGGTEETKKVRETFEFSESKSTLKFLKVQSLQERSCLLLAHCYGCVCVCVCSRPCCPCASSVWISATGR